VSGGGNVPVEDFGLAEMFQASLVSFDPDCWEFKFRRTIPVAVYVDAEDHSADLGADITALVNGALKDSEFEEPQEFARFHGSLITLGLSQSRVPLDGPTFGEKLGSIKNKVIGQLEALPWKKAGAAVKIAVAIGTVVIIVSGAPAAAPVIGSFAVPVKIWMVLRAAREGAVLAEELKNILVDSKAAEDALREGRQEAWSRVTADSMRLEKDIKINKPMKKKR
jgi:hypothetical protein